MRGLLLLLLTILEHWVGQIIKSFEKWEQIAQEILFGQYRSFPDEIFHHRESIS